MLILTRVDAANLVDRALDRSQPRDRTVVNPYEIDPERLRDEEHAETEEEDLQPAVDSHGIRLLRTFPDATACRRGRPEWRPLATWRSNFRVSFSLLGAALHIRAAPETVAAGDVQQHEAEERHRAEDVDQIEHVSESP